MTSPILFIGHGSPMNAIESNLYTQSWQELGATLEKPRAILYLSAHWITEGETRIGAHPHPGMIYDMYGFPEELYRVTYDAPGSPDISTEIVEYMKGAGYPLVLDSERGYDHGVWSVLIHMFPDADVPVIPLSLDYRASPRWHYEFGQKCASLREQGILIIASGNITHNLIQIDWSGNGIFDGTEKFDARIARAIENRDYDDILDFQSWGDIARFAHPTYDHLLPLFPLLGMLGKTDTHRFLTPEIVYGSLSMRSIIWDA